MLGAALAVTGLCLLSSPLTVEDGGSPSLLIHAERVIVKPGVELERHDILVQDGVIVAVGEGLVAPDGTRELFGKVVCAGFLDAWSSLGLEAGSANDEGTSASTRSADAVDRYTSPHHLGDALRNGVTSARVQAGGRASAGGFGAMLRLDPSLDSEQAVVLDDTNQAVTVGTPRGGRLRDIFDRVGEVSQVVGKIESGRKYAESWTEYGFELEEWRKAVAEKEEELEKDFKKAKKDRDKEIKEAKEKDKEFKEERYKEDKKPRRPKSDPDDAAMARVANGEVPLVVEIHRHSEIRSLLAKTEKYGRLRMILAGATESLDHARTLSKRGIPVIVWPQPDQPSGDRWDGHDLGLAGKLADAGVKVLIGSGGTDTTRELRLLAALAVSQGLSREDGLNGITLGVAEAFDLAGRLGSVERGKDADLVILDGDPLDTTARVRLVISHGRVVVEQ